MSQSLEFPISKRRFRDFGATVTVMALLVAAGMALRISQSGAESARTIPAPVLDQPANARATSDVAILAGGCFWGVQGVFQDVEGVASAVSGYAGGAADTAHYQMVGSDAIGHAEAVQVTFDPRHISYGRILQIYFSVAHDPTELNRQGPDVGTQYRSAIFRPLSRDPGAGRGGSTTELTAAARRHPVIRPPLRDPASNRSKVCRRGNRARALATPCRRSLPVRRSRKRSGSAALASARQTCR
jgi:methionine-S-sulfoxide reductase